MDAPPWKPRQAFSILAALFGLLVAVGSFAGGVQAQAFTYSSADLATVRVFALKRIEAQRIPTGPRAAHTVAVPIVSHGSGMVVSADGLILTAQHVVAGGSALAVMVPGRDRAYPAEVVYEDAELDFAFLSVPGYFEHVIELPPVARALRVREPVHAVGYPVDPQLEHPLSSPGIVAGALGDGRIQLGISLNPGNSGGPLLDAEEAVIGIVIARGDPSKGVLGMGVATPTEPIQQALERVRARLPAPTLKQVDDPVAGLVVQLAVLGPVGLLREAAAALRRRVPLESAQRLEAMAGADGNADLLALSAAFTWDALIMRLVDLGAEANFESMPASERAHVLQWLRQTVALCHRAAARDPSLPFRSGFVAYVLDRWPDADDASPPTPETPAGLPDLLTRHRTVPTSAGD